MLRSSGVALVLFSFLVTSVNSQTNDVPNAEPTFQSKVRLVLLDITVTDKNDQPVSGLKQEDFEVFEEGKPQTIDSFEEHKGAPPAAAEPTPLPMNVYSNTPPPRSSDSVNVLVLDALNTELADQSYVHKQMADYLKEVQPGTRLAIFTLSSQLRMVEGFTADPSVLIAALNHKNWGGGPQSSQMLRTQSEDNTDQQLVNDMAGMPGNAAAIAMMKQFLEESKDFEKYQRVQTTLFALQELGRYLGWFPGRKNLIWFSGSFPIDILPTQGQNYDFSFSDQYKQQLRETTNLLAAAQVAIYPISAQGIDNDAYYQASYNFKPDLSDTSTSSQGQGQSQNQSQANGGGSSGMLAHAATLDQNKQLQAEHSERHANEDSMDEIAKDTGGKAFYNTNGLKDAMAHVISNGTHYYTISYSPTDKSLDGKYRPITVKLRDAKYKLAYRRGYFSDTTKSAEQKSSNGNPLLPLMARDMPDATQILYQVHVSPKDSQPSEHSPVASDNAKFQGPAIRYGADFDVEAKDLSLEAGPDGTRHGSLEASLVVYDHDGNLLNWIARRIELSYTPNRYAAVEQSGIPFHLDIDAPKGNIYLRTGIYEASTSKAGTLEIPLNTVKAFVEPTLAKQDTAIPAIAPGSVIAASDVPALRSSMEANIPEANPQTLPTNNEHTIPTVHAGKNLDPAFYCNQISRTSEHSDALANVCEFALSFSTKLPDIICDREMNRHWKSPDGRLSGEHFDRVTGQMVYRHAHEYYVNLKVDGKPADPKSNQWVGATWSSGEFATSLFELFLPQSAADFHFEKQATIHSVSALVFRFSVEKKNNKGYFLHAENPYGETFTWYPAYHGRMWVDAETFHLLRLERGTADMLNDPIQRVDTVIDYAYVPLGDGSNFVLPTESEVITCIPHDQNDCARNIAKFTNWHMFRAKSQILMDPTQ